MYQLMLQENLLECISYQNPFFTVRAYEGNLYEYLNHAVPTHWHSEIEFIYIKKGQAVYHVNEQKIPMKAGDGLFVNSNRLHYGYSPEGSDFIYAVLQFHPNFIQNSTIRQKYLNPLISDAGRDSYFFGPSIPWQAELLDKLDALIDMNLRQTVNFELQTHTLLYSILHIMSERNVIRTQISNEAATHILALQDMLTFIQDHYAEHISLDDIATAGAMCRSKCCALFKQVLQQSPMNFTQAFRIQKSLTLLLSTDLTITEIASLCGFSSPSYYVEVFHRRMGASPKNFRSSIQIGPQIASTRDQAKAAHQLHPGQDAAGHAP